MACRVEIRATSDDEWHDVGPVLPADADRAAAERCLAAARAMYPRWQHRLRPTPCPHWTGRPRWSRGRPTIPIFHPPALGTQ